MTIKPLSFTQQGEQGAPLIILHGLFGSSTNWKGIASRLAENFRVYTLDARNHGQSFHHDSMTYQEMADDVAHFLNQQGLNQVLLLGHSMGGKTACTFALSHPERVAKLVVVDIAPVSYPRSLGEFVTALKSLDLAEVTSRRDADRKLQEKISDRALRAFLLQNLSLSDGQYRWRINLDAIDHNMQALMQFPAGQTGKTFGGPSLFIAGEQSDYITAEHQEALDSLFPGQQIATVSDAGHWVHAEQPDKFINCVNGFLI